MYTRLHGVIYKTIVFVNENATSRIITVSMQAAVAYFKVLLQRLNRATVEDCEITDIGQV
jgi:hypothetical protein